MKHIITNCTLIVSKKDNRIIEIISDFTLFKDIHTDCNNEELYTVRARFSSKGRVITPGYRMSRTKDGQYFIHALNK